MKRTDSTSSRRDVIFHCGTVRIADIVAIAEGSACARLPDDPVFRGTIRKGAELVDMLVRQRRVVYGVNTGFGDSCTVTLDPDLISELPRHLYTYHGCGLGSYLSPPQTCAVIATRLASLCKGFSGVSLDLLEQLVTFLDHDLLPAIPCEGSV